MLTKTNANSQLMHRQFERMSLAKKILTKTLSNLLFPQFCMKCDKFGALLCEDCIKEHKLNTIQRCPHCEKRSVGGFVHTACIGKTPIDRLIVATKYGALEQKLVHKLKYKNNKECAEIIAKLIDRKIRKKINFQNFILCPIPLHKSRLRHRGYNQSKLLATKLSERIPTLTVQNLLIRTKDTKQQNKLNKQERAQNLKNAFQLTPSIKVPRQVLLIDDVTTSGSTFGAAAITLKKNGAKTVWCLAFTRGK